MSLSNKYRPKTFNEVYGQQGTIAVLKKQVQLGKVKNAYLFVGKSGCGKTTLARILASELNGKDNTAIEIDAASNSGVENVRNLIATANEHSIESTYKIIILDECHSFSSQAWQALLKTIEEPPKYTIFIFCTTNPEKIPQTILNRCQRFEFTAISPILIKTRLEYICRQEGFINFDDSIDYISKNCNGQMRDAVTLLEQIADYDINFNIDNTIALIGKVNYARLFDLINNIIDGNESELFSSYYSIIENYTDSKKFVKQLLEIELDINKYISLNNMSFSNLPVSYETNIKNCTTFNNPEDAKKVHSYLLKNILSLYLIDTISVDVVLAYLLKMSRFE